MKEYYLLVDCLQQGQPRPYAPSIFEYNIVDKSNPPLHKNTVLDFCNGSLRKSYEKKNMPCPFAGERLSFEQVDERKYHYKVREEYTG